MQDGYFHRGLFTSMLNQSVLRPRRRRGGLGGLSEVQLQAQQDEARKDPDFEAMVTREVEAMRERQRKNPYPPLGKRS